MGLAEIHGRHGSNINRARPLPEADAEADADTYTQAKLAEDLGGEDEGAISRLARGKRTWSPRLYQKAFDYMRKYPGTADLTLSDLFDLSSVDLVRKVVHSTQEQHRLIGLLYPEPRLTPNDEKFSSLVGFYACAYLCIDPNNTNELGISVDSFELRKGERVDELFVEQTNFPHDPYHIPRGRARLRGSILELDIGYMSDYPDGKFLAFLPHLDVNSRYNFVATMLDVKIKSRLVVARPALFMQLESEYTSWEVFPKESDLFVAAYEFIKSNAQFEAQNFELCPSREARWGEWRPVVAALKKAIHQ